MKLNKDNFKINLSELPNWDSWYPYKWKAEINYPTGLLDSSNFIFKEYGIGETKQKAIDNLKEKIYIKNKEYNRLSVIALEKLHEIF